MGTKVRNRNLRLNHSKTFPIPTKFYQSSSFYIPYGMPIKKTPNESQTTKRDSGNSPRNGLGRADQNPCAAQTQNRGFSFQYPKSDHFPSKPSLYYFPTPSITSYNINLYQFHKIDDHLIIKHPFDPFDIHMHELATCIN